MKTVMNYGANTFGNADNAGCYTVRLTRSAGQNSITISFKFANPASGRGVGSSRGKVKDIELELPRETSAALSHALQLALADTASAEVEFKIDEHKGG